MAHGLGEVLGPSSIGYWAYLLQAYLQARAFEHSQEPVPVLYKRKFIYPTHHTAGSWSRCPKPAPTGRPCRRQKRRTCRSARWRRRRPLRGAARSRRSTSGLGRSRRSLEPGIRIKEKIQLKTHH